MLNNLKLFLNISDTSSDALLNLIINDCIDDFEEFTDTEFDDTDTKMQALLVQMAIIRYNRLGIQGISSQKYSEMSEAFTDGYPKEIRNRLIKYKMLRCL